MVQFLLRKTSIFNKKDSGWELYKKIELGRL